MDTFTSAPVILSSSFAKSTPHGFGSTPSRQINSQPYSSPDLPSPSELLGAPREKSTSSEMPAHWDATANGFTKASNLLHSLPVVEVLKETNQLAYDQEKLATELEGELRLADSVQVRQDDGVRVGQNKPRKRRKSASAPSPAVPRHSDTKEFKITKQKNPAKKKALQEAAQSKIKGKVKKPRVSLKGEDTSETTKQCEGDTVPPIERQMEIDTVIDLEKGNLALGLGKVSARRREWTPVRDSEATGHTGDASNDGTNHIEPASSAKLAAQLSSFECDTTALPRATSASVRGIATKRRKIDLIDGRQPSRQGIAKSGIKPSIPKKKQQTLTEKATEPYQQPNPETSLFDFFETPTDFHGERSNSTAKSEPLKKLEKSKKKKSVSLKVMKRDQKVYTPEHAIQTLDSQDLLFGTSSQLVREESPGLVREVQQALKESEASVEEESFSTEANSYPAFVAPLQSSRSLWAAAARDTDGSLLDVVDLTYTPSNDVANVTPVKPLTEESSWLDMESLVTPLPVEPTVNVIIASKELEESKTLSVNPKEQSALPTLASTARPQDLEVSTSKIPPAKCQSTEIVGIANGIPKDKAESTPSIQELYILPRSVAEGALRPRTKSKSPVKRGKRKSASASMPLMPEFAAYTQAELDKTVASYGFKQIKKRKTMIELVQRCWESENKLALHSLSNTNHSNVNPKELDCHANETTKAKRDRSPKRKTKNKAATGVDQKESHPKQPKPRGRPRKTQTPSDPNSSVAPALYTPCLLDNVENTHDVENKENVNSIEDALLSNEQTLFAKITEAITTFPPSNDLHNLGWHEKILLYDPIVLEDLATWLNTVGLQRVGVDEEVWPGLVREWCESRSICCLWKANLRGGERRRY